MERSSIRKPYPSDVTDAQWELIQPLLRTHDGPGRPTAVDLREIGNALLSVKQTGCQWRFLPHDFPFWRTVHYTS